MAFMLHPLLATNESKDSIGLLGSDNGNEIVKDEKQVLVKKLKKF